MTKIYTVRYEFKESFHDVVKGLATIGYSRRAVADVLNFNLSYFREVCTRFNLHQYFKPQCDMLPECRSHGKGWPKGKKQVRKPRYTDEYLLSVVKQYPGYSDFMSCAPVSISTVTRRFRLPWFKIVNMAER